MLNNRNIYLPCTATFNLNITYAFNNEPISESEIYDLYLMKNKYLVGLDEPSTYLFNQPFVEGYFPDTFKEALVIRLFKNGKEHYVNNYSQISLLDYLSKFAKITGK